jgi:hypothetical protein
MTQQQRTMHLSNIQPGRTIKTAIVLLAAALLLAACGTPTQHAERAPTASAIPSSANRQEAAQAPTAQLAPTVQPTPTVSQNVPGGYLFVDDYDVQFVQWIGDPSGQVQGTYQRLHVPPGDSFGVESESGTLTLTRQPNSNDIRVTFDNGETYIGTLQGNTLTLVVPSESGELRTIEYRRATVDEYNTAARSLQEKLNQQAAEAHAAYEEQARLDTLNQQWQAANTEAEQYIERLAVTAPELWFTDQDSGRMAQIISYARGALSYVEGTQVYEGCPGLPESVEDVRAYQEELVAYRREFDTATSDFQAHVRTMKATRDALGDTAPEYILETTNTIEAQTQPKIELVNQKFDKAEQVLQGIVQEAEALTCPTAEQ